MEKGENPISFEFGWIPAMPDLIFPPELGCCFFAEILRLHLRLKFPNFSKNDFFSVAKIVFKGFEGILAKNFKAFFLKKKGVARGV